MTHWIHFNETLSAGCTSTTDLTFRVCQFKPAATDKHPWQTQKSYISASFTDNELKVGVVVTETNTSQQNI